MRPSIASRRASSAAFMAGSTFQKKNASTMMNASVPHTRSGMVGMSGLTDSSAAMVTVEVSIQTPRGFRAGLRRGERDEGDGDRDEAEGLGQCDTEEHQAAEAALELGLTCDRLDRLADDDAHADTGADDREAEGEGSELSDDVHGGVSF